MNPHDPADSGITIYGVDAAAGASVSLVYSFDRRTGILTVHDIPQQVSAISITVGQPRFTRVPLPPPGIAAMASLVTIPPRKPQGPPAPARPRREWWNRRP